MSAQQVHPRPIPRQWRSFITRIKTQLSARGLLRVLDSLPLATSFAFYEAVVLKKSAISFLLGFRTQAEGIQARSWAYILLEAQEFNPPVLFRDEMPVAPGSDARPQLFLRSAVSLLRKTDALLPPFCFLQVDPHDDATNVRGMVCSLARTMRLPAA